jgi:hypothetical protein
MSKLRLFAFGLSLCTFVLTACDCGGEPPNNDAGDSEDGGYDAGTDAGYDAGFDGGYDAGYDGGSDAGYDAGYDGGYDAGYDGGYDAGYDGGYDAGPPTCVMTGCMTDEVCHPLGQCVTNCVTTPSTCDSVTESCDATTGYCIAAGVLGETWRMNVAPTSGHPGAWEQRLQADGPAARWRTAMATSGRGPVMFGGLAGYGVRLGDTWVWEVAAIAADGGPDAGVSDGGMDEIWVRVDGAAPSAREQHAMASDGTDVYLFGGMTDSALVNDLWRFDGTSWTQLSPSGTPPSPRLGMAMDYGTVRGTEMLVVHGGDDGSGTLDDTWAYDPSGNTWTELMPVQDDAGDPDIPSARAGHSFNFRTSVGVPVDAILYGGDDGADAGSPSVWVFDDVDGGSGLVDRFARQGADGVRVRVGHSAAYGAEREQLVIFGGTTLDNRHLGAPEVYAGGNAWAPFDLYGPGPGPTRAYGAMAADADGRFLAFGGISDGETARHIDPMPAFGGLLSTSINYTPPMSGLAGATFSLGTTPGWITLNSSTGRLSGTIPGTPGTTDGQSYCADLAGEQTCLSAIKFVAAPDPRSYWTFDVDETTHGQLSGQTGSGAVMGDGPGADAGLPGGLIRVSGLTGIENPYSEGRFLRISGASDGDNNGDFEIVNVVSSSAVDIAGGVAPGGESGLTWAEIGDVLEDRGGPESLKVSGTVDSVAGLVGGESYMFDGVNDGIFGTAPGAYTTMLFSVVVSPTDVDGLRPIANHGLQTDRGWRIYIEDGLIRARVGDGLGTTRLTWGPIEPGDVRTIALRADGTGVALYVDGAEVAVDTSAQLLLGTGRFAVGRSEVDGVSFAGRIDEAIFWPGDDANADVVEMLAWRSKAKLPLVP